MNESPWPHAYRVLAELLLRYYEKYDKVAGALLFSLCENQPDSTELFSFITRFRRPGANASLDPVNLFASFSGQHTPASLRVLRYNFYLEVISRHLEQDYQKLEIIDFDGCPTPRTSNILKSRGLEQDRQLWQLFADVMEKGPLGVNSATFLNLKQWNGLQIPAFTIFLFWIDSDHFIPMDNNTVSYLRNQNLLKSRSLSYLVYRALLQITEGMDYVQLSKEAYYFKNSAPPEPYTNIEQTVQPKAEPPFVTFPPEQEAPVTQGIETSFKRVLESRIGEFKIIGLKVYEDTDIKWKRVLSVDRVYQFSHAYDLADHDLIKYDASKDLRLYNIKGTSISISAIVGKNGSGKSSLVDLIYIVLNNLSERHPAIKDTMIYVADVHVDFYYAAEDLYLIKLRGENISIRRFVAAGKDYRFEEELTVADFNLEDLFYTVSLNYAHFSLNSRHIGDWINHLFHKNDAYQQPLVLNPHRNEGNIDVNEEESFASARLMSNLLFFDPDETGKVSMFRELTDKQQAEQIELTVEYSKLEFLYVINAPTKKEPDRKLFGQWENSTEIWPDFIKLVIDIFELEKEEVTVTPLLVYNWTDIAYKYLLRKAVTMALKYKKYQGEYLRTKHEFKDLKNYLKRIRDDNSHITYKFKQAINFLKYVHLKPFLLGKQLSDTLYIPINDLSVAMYGIVETEPEAELSTVLLIPPAFFKPDVILTGDVRLSGLSSGEKQRIFAASTIAYHLINIDSGNTDDSQVRYKFVNIIFDEIELYYHPEMQRTLINYLLKYISYLPLELAGLNITFITHSPFILSDIPADNIAFLGREATAWKTLGANIHDMLADSFFLNKGVMGEYVKGTVISLTAFLTGKQESGDFSWTRESSADVIQMMGEPVIQKQLQLLWQKKYSAVDRRAEIEELKTKLRRLEDEESSQ